MSCIRRRAILFGSSLWRRACRDRHGEEKTRYNAKAMTRRSNAKESDVVA